MQEESEISLDPQLWRACAGPLVKIPPVNSTVYYFPQGHLEHANAHAHTNDSLPWTVNSQPQFCRVVDVKFLAVAGSDDVYAKISLLPQPDNERDLENDAGDEKLASFNKTLTQNDGGLSVPRYCAETIFPRLDYSMDPPVQTVIAKDIHGEIWKFRHIYRGTPRRHLLTTGWSYFVIRKKLLPGDSVLFLRSNSGDLRIGIRRAGSISISDNRSDYVNTARLVTVDAVLEAVERARIGQAFEVVYWPRLNTPEYCVKSADVRAAMRRGWCHGMRLKMAFEKEDYSGISWFMGTVSSVQAADLIRWPDSWWRILQVVWDEPYLLGKVKSVSPWQVELVSNMTVTRSPPEGP